MSRDQLIDAMAIAISKVPLRDVAWGGAEAALDALLAVTNPDGERLVYLADELERASDDMWQFNEAVSLLREYVEGRADESVQHEASVNLERITEALRERARVDLYRIVGKDEQ